MDPPLVNKFDLDASPIMTIGVSGRRDVREVTEIAKHQIQDNLQTVPGVGAVFLSGGRSRAINVIVNTDQLASYDLSVEDVRHGPDHAEPGSARRHRPAGAARAGAAHAGPHAKRRRSSTN